jgi:hypothetical protein
MHDESRKPTGKRLPAGHDPRQVAYLIIVLERDGCDSEDVDSDDKQQPPSSGGEA